jgi:hypothetical protein
MTKSITSFVLAADPVEQAMYSAIAQHGIIAQRTLTALHNQYDTAYPGSLKELGAAIRAGKIKVTRGG